MNISSSQAPPREKGKYHSAISASANSIRTTFDIQLNPTPPASRPASSPYKDHSPRAVKVARLGRQQGTVTGCRVITNQLRNQAVSSLITRATYMTAAADKAVHEIRCLRGHGVEKRPVQVQVSHWGNVAVVQMSSGLSSFTIDAIEKPFDSLRSRL